MLRARRTLGAIAFLAVSSVAGQACLPITSFGVGDSTASLEAGADAAPDALPDAPQQEAGRDAGTDASPDADAGTICRSANFTGTGAAGMFALQLPVHRPAGAFTVEAWMKISAAPASLALIAGQADADLTGSLSAYALELTTDLRPVFVASDGVSTVTLPSATPLATGTWVHVAGVFDGVNATLYVGGQQLATLPSGFARVQGVLDNFAIGNPLASQPTNREFNGSIDEVRVSSIARYAAAFAPSPRFATDASTIALYHMDTDDGVFTPDDSTSANNAPFIGPVTFPADCPP